MSAPDPNLTVTLSLVSHTNVGKTTLARTLLKRDIGEVRDDAHVTEVCEAYPMITSPAGHHLRIWDTPGFGDSIRLRNRLRARTGSNPVGWFLGEIWDRWANRPLWCSQQALRNVHDEADLVLYLVNAAESPAAVGYLDPEMEILAWLDKPIVALLNHTARDAATATADTAAWRERLAAFPLVRAVMDLDAFSRCWVQEDALLARLAVLVPPARRPAAEALAAAWHERNQSTFDAAMVALANHLARTARDRAPVPPSRGVRDLLAHATGRSPRPPAAASQDLVTRLDADKAATLAQLLTLHGLEPGEAVALRTRLAEAFVTHGGLDETSTTILGGLVSGALTGLTTDFLAGGLTFGGGAVTGAILGATAAKLAAAGFNRIRDDSGDGLRWSPEMLLTFARLALLRYLAVAHHGRGRGRFTAAIEPATWTAALDPVLQSVEPELRAALATAEADALHRPLSTAAREALAQLHPPYHV